MRTKSVRKIISVDTKTHDAKWWRDIVSILAFTFGTTSFLLLFPSLSRLPVFARGQFAYPESVGIVFIFVMLFSIFMFPVSNMIRGIRQPFKCLATLGITAGGVFFMLLVITFSWIRFDVKTNCQDAREEYGGSCAEALSRQLADSNQGFRARNSAVWTLGQLADKGSLPILRKYYTGNIPSREPLSKTLSQYELKKAIKWCEQGNVTSWMYGGL